MAQGVAEETRSLAVTFLPEPATLQVAALAAGRGNRAAHAEVGTGHAAFCSSRRSCLIRNSYGQPIADHFKLSPTDQQLIDSQRNITRVVAGSLHNRARGQRKKVADGESHHR